MKVREWLYSYRKPVGILSAIAILNLIFGFDARFTIINLLWLLL